MFLVKISAWKKKLVGLVLGVVTVKVSMLSRVALTRMVEQALAAVLGSMKSVRPYMAQRASGRWQQSWLQSVVVIPAGFIMGIAVLKVPTVVQTQLDEQRRSDPAGQAGVAVVRPKSNREYTKATLMQTRAPVGLLKVTTGPKGVAVRIVTAPGKVPSVRVSYVFGLFGLTPVLTPAQRQWAAAAAGLNLNPIMQAWTTCAPPPVVDPSAAAGVAATQPVAAAKNESAGSIYVLQLSAAAAAKAPPWLAAPIRSTPSGLLSVGFSTSATVAQMSEKVPLKVRETTRQVKLTMFHRVMLWSAGFLKSTTTLILLYWFSYETLWMLREQKELVQVV